MEDRLGTVFRNSSVALALDLTVLFFEALWRIYLDCLQVEQVEPL